MPRSLPTLGSEGSHEPALGGRGRQDPGCSLSEELCSLTHTMKAALSRGEEGLVGSLGAGWWLEPGSP